MSSMNDVYWLEQTSTDVPPEDKWLSEAEAARLERLRFAKRRNDWRLGRWTAKVAVSRCFGLPTHAPQLTRIEIAANGSGAPEALVSGFPQSVPISLSHRAGRAICAVAPGSAEIGCDLELIEPRSDAFVDEFFSALEIDAISQVGGRERAVVANALWSAKESTLKALRIGLAANTREIEVDLGYLVATSRVGGAWRPLQVRKAGGRRFRGWWETSDDFVRTVVTYPATGEPVSLLGLSQASF